MDSKQLSDAATIAISLPATERVAYLAGVFKNEPGYIQRVMKLVESHQENRALQTSAYSIACVSVAENLSENPSVSKQPAASISVRPPSRFIPIALSVSAAAFLATSITFGFLALNAQQTNNELSHVVDELSETVMQLEMAQAAPVAPVGTPVESTGIRSASLPTQWR